MKYGLLICLNWDLAVRYQLCKHCLLSYPFANCLEANCTVLLTVPEQQRKNQSAPYEVFPYMLYFQILSDQYHLQDVLERSDQVMAVAKDLFGDAPRTRTGRPSYFYVIVHLRLSSCFS